MKSLFLILYYLATPIVAISSILIYFYYFNNEAMAIAGFSFEVFGLPALPLLVILQGIILILWIITEMGEIEWTFKLNKTIIGILGFVIIILILGIGQEVSIPLEKLKLLLLLAVSLGHTFYVDREKPLYLNT